MPFRKNLRFTQAHRAAWFPVPNAVVFVALLGIPLLSFASDELREGRDFRLNDCYARFEGTHLVLGNAHVRRTWRVEHGILFATSLIDLDSQKEWLSAPSRLASTTVSNSRDAENPILRGGSGTFGPTESKSLRVELEESRPGALIDYEFQVFPQASGIRMWVKVINSQAEPASIASPEPGSNAPTRADVIDHVQVADPHLKLIQVTLRDQTDRHNELVFENEWLVHPNESSLELQGNIFVIEDNISGDGLVFLKEAPQPEMRPIKNTFDLRVSTMHGPASDSETPSTYFDFSFYGQGFSWSGDGYPSTLMVYHGGRTGRIAALQHYQRQIRQYEPERDGQLLSNTWGDRSRETKLNEKFILDEIDAGQRLGVDIVEIDEGWQSGIASGTSMPGGVWENFWFVDPNFWTPSVARFPRGFSYLSKYAHQHGMKLGLWFAPDSHDGFSNWRKDADQLLAWSHDQGIDAFKLDSVNITSKGGENNYRTLLDRVIGESSGRILLDLDVTAEARQGYFGDIAAGALFVENRYTDFHGYWPHQTLRNLWKLAQYVDPVRLRMELLNPDRNRELYRNDPLAPSRYAPSCLFAITMFASPLGWFENTGLSPSYVADVAPLIKKWKQQRESIYRGTIVPIGELPDGTTWTGFVSVAENPISGHLLVFRELNGENTWTAPRSLFPPGKYKIRILGGTGAVSQVKEGFRVKITQPLGFVWARLDAD